MKTHVVVAFGQHILEFVAIGGRLRKVGMLPWEGPHPSTGRYDHTCRVCKRRYAAEDPERQHCDGCVIHHDHRADQAAFDRVLRF